MSESGAVPGRHGVMGQRAATGVAGVAGGAGWAGWGVAGGAVRVRTNVSARRSAPVVRLSWETGMASSATVGCTDQITPYAPTPCPSRIEICSG